MASEERLKLEYLRAQLAGRPGLRRDGARYAADENGRVPLTKKRLSDTLAYIGTISTYHPDREIGSALQRRVTTVLEHLRSLRDNPESRDTSA